jgi:hypothetical protein
MKDRYVYFKDFFDNFYNVDKLSPERISPQAWQASFKVATGAAPHASYACIDSWLTDFRADLPKIDVPVLVVHGTEDRVLPFESTAKRLPDLVATLSSSPSKAVHTTSAGRFPMSPTRLFWSSWPRTPVERGLIVTSPPPRGPGRSLRIRNAEAGPVASTHSATGPPSWLERDLRQMQRFRPL